MNIFQLAHSLTAVLIILKLIGLISIGWLLVFLPSLVCFGLGILVAVIGAILVLIGLRG